jgi:hypothetical protein
MEFLGTTELNPGFATNLVAPNSPTTAASSSTTYDVDPLTLWIAAIAGSSWVSNTATAGPGCNDDAECQLNGFYYYETTFSAATGKYDVTLDIMADDTAEVLLNGVVVIPFGSIGSDSYCSDGQPNCASIDMVSFIANLSGSNTLEIIDAQTGGGPEGVDYTATFTSTEPSSMTPEPSSIVLMCTGLLGLALLAFRKAKPFDVALNM